jgi:hypothetical protein
LATRGVPASARRSRRRPVGERDVEDRRRAAHDPCQVLDAVGLEAVMDAEAIAQRRGQQPRAGGGAD